ncbi:MAG: aminotransferase class IV [Acidobacteria bacterium]|nr:aminotransferase class IV [Acidobacteriota bacterium]
MAAVAYVNGRICSQQDALISVFDHGFLFGEGVYEVVRTYHGQPFLLDRHLTRLRTSAQMIALPLPVDDTGLCRAIGDTMKAYVDGPGRDGASDNLYIRILVTRGLGDGSYNPAGSPSSSLVIIVKALTPPPASAYERGVKVSLVSIVRNHPGSVNPLIKSNNLLNNALAMQEAIRHGSFEAILRNYRGDIAECSQSNLFVVKGGMAKTPRLAEGLLAGITRAFIMDVAQEAGVPVEDSVLLDEDLFAADEVFLTSTTREVIPIVRVDDRVIASGAPGPITRRLLDVYRQKADQLTRR